MSQYKVNRMKEIFESKEMAQKIINVGPEKMSEFSGKLSELRFDAQLDKCILENNIKRHQELMQVCLDIHPLKDDPLFIEAMQLASDPEVISYAWEEERQKAS